MIQYVYESLERTGHFAGRQVWWRQRREKEKKEIYGVALLTLRHMTTNFTTPIDCVDCSLAVSFTTTTATIVIIIIIIIIIAVIMYTPR